MNKDVSNVSHESLISLAKAFREVAEIASEIMQGFKEAVTNIYKLFSSKKEDEVKQEWILPLKMIKMDQVMNRKPMMARARSNC